MIPLELDDELDAPTVGVVIILNPVPTGPVDDEELAVDFAGGGPPVVAFGFKLFARTAACFAWAFANAVSAFLTRVLASATALFIAGAVAPIAAHRERYSA